MDAETLNQMVKPLMLSDLRTQLRARGENPGGSEAALRDRLKENMIATGNYNLHGLAPPPVQAGKYHLPV